MHIVSLEVQNLMKVKAVRIRPDGSMVVIGGKNAQGKTSLMNAIEYAIGGKRGFCERPVRDGEKKAKVVVNLGEIIVQRTITESGGGSVTIKNSDGSKVHGPPQRLLDSLFNKLTFDPLVFFGLDKHGQRDALMDVLGIDLSEIDKAAKEQYDERTDVRRRIREVQSRIDGIVIPQGTPKEPVSVDALMQEHRAGVAANQARDDLEREIGEVKDRYLAKKRREKDIESEIDRLRKRIEDIESEKKTVREQVEQLVKTGIDLKKKFADTPFVELADVEAKISSASEINKNVDRRVLLDEMETELDDWQSEDNRLTASIEAVPEKKRKLIAEANVPIDGLSVDGDTVIYNGTPLEQCSSAEQIRVSVAMGIAMNPKLRVFLVRNGALLDEDSKRLLAELAEEHDAQFWVEVVGNPSDCQVVIHDGEILEDEESV